MKIVFFGTPDFAADYLDQLLTAGVGITAVVTQPDRPAGRKQTLTPTPVKITAQKYNIPILDPASVSDLRPQTSDLNPDLAILFAYGKILPESMLTMPKYGFLNIHPSLLPKYRGAAPIAYALMMGDKTTGVTLIKLDSRVDHGPIVARKALEILPDETRPQLEKRLTDLAVEMTIKLFSTNPAKSRIQNDNEATYTRFLTKNDGFIPYETLKKILHSEPIARRELPRIILEYYERNTNEPVENLTLKISNSPKTFHDLFRGLMPWPGIWTFVLINGTEKRLKITGMSYSSDEALANGKVTITRVRLEGKSEVPFGEFQKAYNLF